MLLPCPQLVMSSRARGLSLDSAAESRGVHPRVVLMLPLLSAQAHGTSHPPSLAHPTVFLRSAERAGRDTRVQRAMAAQSPDGCFREGPGESVIACSHQSNYPVNSYNLNLAKAAAAAGWEDGVEGAEGLGRGPLSVPGNHLAALPCPCNPAVPFCPHCRQHGRGDSAG